MHHATEAERVVARLEPMLLERAPAPFSAPGWWFEIKHDGYRLLCAVAAGAAYLKTRRGANANAWFPEIAAGLIELSGGPHVFDGAAVVLDRFGRADFERLQARARLRGWRAGADPVHFMVFDLLVRDGKDLRGKPLKVRKAALRRLLATPPANVLFVDDIDDGLWLFEQALALKFEGVVAKKETSLYHCGVRSLDWLKIPRPGAVPPQRFRR